LEKGNQVKMYGICVDFFQEESSRVLEMNINFTNNKHDVVVYQKRVTVAAAMNYVCKQLQ